MLQRCRQPLKLGLKSFDLPLGLGEFALSAERFDSSVGLGLAIFRRPEVGVDGSLGEILLAASQLDQPGRRLLEQRLNGRRLGANFFGMVGSLGRGPRMGCLDPAFGPDQPGGRTRRDGQEVRPRPIEGQRFAVEPSGAGA